MKRQNFIAILIFAVALVIRVPCRSQFAFHWDSAQYALAVQHYDWRISQPQTPGYAVYVALGKVFSRLTGDPHAGLVWISLLAGAAMAALGYWLGMRMFGEGCGLGTGLILATSPLCWFQSEVAMTNMLDGALVTGTIWMAWNCLNRKERWWPVIGMAVLFAAVAGNRQQSAPLLVPACGYALWKSGSWRLWKTFVAVLLAGVLCLAWLIPMMQSSGGLHEYLACLEAKRRLGESMNGWKSFASLQDSLYFIVGACWEGLWIGALLFGVELLDWLRSKERTLFLRERREALLLCAGWIVPFLLFGTLFYTSMSGQVLAYFAVVVMAVSLGLERMARRVLAGKMWIPLTAVMSVNAIVFLFQPRVTDRFLEGIPSTYPAIRENDQKLKEWTDLVRSRFRPEDVLICHRGELYQWSFRHFQYHLPEYRNVMFTHDPSLPSVNADKFWAGKGPNTAFIDRVTRGMAGTMLLFVPPGQTLEEFAPFFDLTAAREVEGSAGVFYAVPGEAVRR